VVLHQLSPIKGIRAWDRQDLPTPIVALPYCNLSLKARKPRCKAYPQKVLCLGDAIRKRWLDLRLLQKDLAEIIGCDKDTITNCENGRRSPTISHMAKIAKFLRYNPYAQGVTLADQLVSHRKAHGLRQRDLARQIGIDPSTLASYEQGQEPAAKYRALLENFFRS
jgi:transcriptional regulator with XRE-family HTH domain